MGVRGVCDGPFRRVQEPLKPCSAHWQSHVPPLWVENKAWNTAPFGLMLENGGREVSHTLPFSISLRKQQRLEEPARDAQ